MSQLNKDRIAAYKVFNCLAPRSESKSLHVAFDFSISSTINFDLSQAQQEDKIEWVQGVYIDNSNNTQSVALKSTISNQSITIQAGWQGFFPTLTPNPPSFILTSAGAAVVPIQFLNFPVQANTWPATNATTIITGSVSTIANTTGGVSTYSAQGGTGNALITNTPVQIKAGAGNLYGLSLYNSGGAISFLQIFDALAASVTLGTTVPKLVVPVFGNGTWEEKFTDEAKISFTTGITIAATDNINDNGAPSAAFLANILYK